MKMLYYNLSIFYLSFFLPIGLFAENIGLSIEKIEPIKFNKSKLLEPYHKRPSNDKMSQGKFLNKTVNVFTGAYSLICQNEEGTYNPNMENFVYSPEITLPPGSQVDADFMVRGALIDFNEFPYVDYWGIQITPDGGISWYYISNPYGDPEGINYVYVDTPEMWSSFNSTYLTPIDIDNYAGITVQFRFFFHSDEDDIPPEAEGLWLDDFIVRVDDSTIYFEDFEDGTMSGWISEDETATPGMWHQTTVEAYEGRSWRMADPEIGPSGGYLDHWYQVLDTPPVTLPGDGEMTVTFMQRRAIENICTSDCPACNGPVTFDGWDAFNVRISDDGGVSWEVLTPTSPTYNTDVTYSFGFEFDEGCAIPGWGGPEINPTWTSTIVPIPSTYLGQGVIIRFAFASDPAYSTMDNPNLTGVWIDNIDIAGVFTNDGEDSTGFYAHSLVTIGGDLWHVAYTGEEPQFPAPTNLMAEAGDQIVFLSWDPIEVGTGGEIAYDNDDGSGSSFTNGIYTPTGTFVAGEYFDALFGAELSSVKIFGYSSNTGSETTVFGYSASGGSIGSFPTYEKSISLTTDVWNEVDLSAEGWIFIGDFVIGFEVGTFADNYIIYAPLDESAIPSAHSYVNLGGWNTWQSVAEANSLPDGEWGIRVVTKPGEEVSVVYNIYRHVEGMDYGDPLWYGSAWPEHTFEDPFVFNGNTYWYVVTAIYNYDTPDEAESPFSNEVEVTLQSTTVYEISYDDGSAEIGATYLGDGGFYAVKFAPLEYPVILLKVKYYATSSGGLTWVKLFDDNGENGMPGSELGSTFQFSSINQGWNEMEISQEGIVIQEGNFFVGWGETIDSPPLGLDTNEPIEGNSYFQILGDPWASISDLGYSADLMIRVQVDAAVSILPESDKQVPINFTLAQNYPNPFNTSTSISFELPKGSQVTLKIYDVTGKLVKEFINQWLPAGRYTYDWDVSHFASGIYLYQLRSNELSKTKKMLLLK